METSLIETMIADKCVDSHADADLHDLLAVVAERNGQKVEEKALDKGSRFVRGYIELVPYMMKVAWTAANNVGLDQEMDRVLEMVTSYWEQDDDIIPDHLGIIGLLDDAYCSLCSLQAVSDHFQLQSGKHLFPDDLTAANKMMRKIIGEPYGSDLDRLVLSTMREAGVIESMKKYSSIEKQLDFANQSTIWGHGSAGEIDIQDLAGLGLMDEESRH